MLMIGSSVNIEYVAVLILVFKRCLSNADLNFYIITHYCPVKFSNKFNWLSVQRFSGV